MVDLKYIKMKKYIAFIWKCVILNICFLSISYNLYLASDLDFSYHYLGSYFLITYVAANVIYTNYKNRSSTSNIIYRVVNIVIAVLAIISLNYGLVLIVK